MSEYLVKGTYGCIIKPNIKCNGSFGNVNEITKFFFNKEDYLIEKKNHEKIEKIDNKYNFVIKKINNCKIILTPEIKQKIKNLDLCKLKSDEVYQITYEYGGLDLYDIFEKKYDDLLKINLFTFLQNFAKIFEGLSKINKNNLIHKDIKLNNILYNFEKKKFIIIDFGFCSNIKKYSKDIETFREKSYRFYPNELNILSNIFYGYFFKDLKKYNLNSNILVSAFESYIYDLNIIYKDNTNPYFKKLLLLINDIYNYFKIDIFINFDFTLYEKIFLKKIKLSKINKDFGNKIDVYMIGLTLFELLLIIFIELKNNPSIEKIPLELFILIKKMLLLNPYDRPTIQQATIEYKSIMKK